MKKIFIAISFLMAILLIPLIYDTVDNVMTETIRVDFETIWDGDVYNMTVSTYDNIARYIEVDETINAVIYIHDIEFNELINTQVFITKYNDDTFPTYDEYISIDTDEITMAYLFNDDTLIDSVAPTGVIAGGWIEFETSSTGIWSVLLSLIPIVFVGGLIVYFVKKNDLSN